ncbi:MAG: hypothetical protein JSV77_04755 [Dehalococcoidales bacterium]|nr:MAG: hypothetical protein JSV77_04755 [Dehalococcoidales bacterium]
MAEDNRREHNRHISTAAVSPCLRQGLHWPFRAVAVILFMTALIVLPLVAHAATRVDNDFTLELRVNGTDIQYQETIVFNPTEDLIVEIYITDVSREITLESVSVVSRFAWHTITTLSEDLDNAHIGIGGYYRNTIVFSSGEGLEFGSLRDITGVFGVTIELRYTTGGPSTVWLMSRNMKIPGNPLNTTAGKAAAAVAGGTVIATAVFLKSLVFPSVAAGTTIPGSVVAKSTSGLLDFVRGRLEPTTRGRVSSNIVKAAKSRIIKDRCPLCDTPIKHGHCYTCQKTTRQVRDEYADKVSTLAAEGARLIASGEVETLDMLSSELNISNTLASDVLAALHNAKLVKLKGITHKLLGKTIIMGIGMGLSTILWVTVGGLVALDTWALVTVLVASVVLPIVITKSLQAKARRELQRAT